MKKIIFIFLFNSLIYGCTNSGIIYDSRTKLQNNQINTIDNNYKPSPFPSGFKFPNKESSVFNGFDGYVIDRTEEVKKEGFIGSYFEILNNVKTKILTALDSDAKLIYSSGTTDELGKTIEKSEYPGLESMFQSNPNLSPTYRWEFIYVSEVKKEVYNIIINYKETIIRKQSWRINSFDKEIKVDSIKAVELVKNAIKDKNFVPPNLPDYPKNTFISSVYNLPKVYVTNIFVEKYKGELVWNINFNFGGDSEFWNSFPKQPNEYTEGKFEDPVGRVNVINGEVVYLSRPTYIWSSGKYNF